MFKGRGCSKRGVVWLQPYWRSCQTTFARWNRQESGSALVEFSFSFLILLMLTFGLIDLGRAVYTANVVQNAAQSGARAGIVNLNAAAGAAQSQLIGLDAAQAQITVSLVSNEQVQVEVTYPLLLITPFLAQTVSGGTIQLSGRARMLMQ